MDVNNKLHKWYTWYPLSEMKKKFFKWVIHFFISKLLKALHYEYKKYMYFWIWTIKHCELIIKSEEWIYTLNWNKQPSQILKSHYHFLGSYEINKNYMKSLMLSVLHSCIAIRNKKTE